MKKLTIVLLLALVAARGIGVSWAIGPRNTDTSGGREGQQQRDRQLLHLLTSLLSPACSLLPTLKPFSRSDLGGSANRGTRRVFVRTRWNEERYTTLTRASDAAARCRVRR